MAPTAVEIRKQPEVTANPGQYKEQSSGPRTYSKKIEEEGTHDQPKAKVKCLAAYARTLKHADGCWK
jgi:hypothetical protein